MVDSHVTELRAFRADVAQQAGCIQIESGTLRKWALGVFPGEPVATESGVDARLSTLSVAPNPAVGSTQINLTVADAQDVRFSLYDALGREVSTVMDRAMAAGQQKYIHVSTEGMPPGVYLVRATGPSLNVSQPIPVVR